MFYLHQQSVLNSFTDYVGAFFHICSDMRIVYCDQENKVSQQNNDTKINALWLFAIVNDIAYKLINQPHCGLL